MILHKSPGAVPACRNKDFNFLFFSLELCQVLTRKIEKKSQDCKGDLLSDPAVCKSFHKRAQLIDPVKNKKHSLAVRARCSLFMISFFVCFYSVIAVQTHWCLFILSIQSHRDNFACH